MIIDLMLNESAMTVVLTDRTGNPFSIRGKGNGGTWFAALSVSELEQLVLDGQAALREWDEREAFGDNDEAPVEVTP